MPSKAHDWSLGFDEGRNAERNSIVDYLENQAVMFKDKAMKARANNEDEKRLANADRSAALEGVVASIRRRSHHIKGQDVRR